MEIIKKSYLCSYTFLKVWQLLDLRWKIFECLFHAAFYPGTVRQKPHSINFNSQNKKSMYIVQAIYKTGKRQKSIYSLLQHEDHRRPIQAIKVFLCFTLMLCSSIVISCASCTSRHQKKGAPDWRFCHFEASKYVNKLWWPPPWRNACQRLPLR